MTTNNLEEFGIRIKKLRQSLNMSQRVFAEKLGMSKSFICDIEKGNSKAGFDFFYKVTNLLNVNLEYLFHGKGEMFVNKESEESLGGKEVGDPIQTVGEMLWYMERSPLMNHTVIGFATKLLYDNINHIKKEIKRYDSIKEKK